MELQSRTEDIRRQGLGLAVISYDSQEILAAFVKQRGITFTMLSDAGSATIKKYGILNPVPEWAIGPNASDPAVQSEVQKYVSVVRPNATMVGIAFPGTFILDRQGRVTARFFEDFYIERNTVSSIMLRLGDRKGTVAGTKISTAHFELTTYPSDSAIAPGNRIGLALEVKPGSRMHVYAPGASNYRVISLKLDTQPFVRTLPMKYPASEIYHFKPLNERVPVFQKPFTLVQEVILEGTPQAQAAFRGKDSLTVTGTLEYQACDDKICYNPASVPLSWTLSLRPLVLERPVAPKQ
ncbi:MAG: redoxin domain-containing protein [Acidobacteria bacterium]|nr:redoxin domain-containing protein [Acidobacteriota bacterium]